MDPSLSKIAREAKAIFFQKHPGRDRQEKAPVDDMLSLIDSYVEAIRRMEARRKNPKPKLCKNGNHDFHERLRRKIMKK